MELTKEKVLAVWAALQAGWGSKVIPKKSSWVMKLCSWFVPGSASNFMETFTTTLGKRIYIPFELGSEGWGEVLTAVHEHVHVRQFKQRHFFALRYLLSKRFRGEVEAEAYATDEILAKAFGLGVIGKKRMLASLAESYALSGDSLVKAGEAYDKALGQEFPEVKIALSVLT